MLQAGGARLGLMVSVEGRSNIRPSAVRGGIWAEPSAPFRLGRMLAVRLRGASALTDLRRIVGVVIRDRLRA
jgi:hypothetical protein